jgi:hypothetical protein
MWIKEGIVVVVVVAAYICAAAVVVVDGYEVAGVVVVDSRRIRHHTIIIRIMRPKKRRRIPMVARQEINPMEARMNISQDIEQDQHRDHPFSIHVESHFGITTMVSVFIVYASIRLKPV